MVRNLSSMTLDCAHKLTVYNTVQTVLKAVDLPSESSQLEEIVHAVLSAAREACANFSEEWNCRVSNSLAQRLPPEVLAECLRAADFTTRVHASHVSRAWRAIAIGDQRLWTAFSRTSFRDLADQRAGFHQLETVLKRSDPLPVHVQLPYSYHGDWDDYEGPLPNALKYGISRIEEYGGPRWAFSESTYYAPGDTFPKILSYSCLDPTYPDDDCDVQLWCNPRKMPNLRRLAGPILSFRRLTTPLTSLTSLCCHLSDEYPEEVANLFPSCPNLVSLDLGSITEVADLPPGPLPRSLHDVTLRSLGNQCIEFDIPLMSWSEYRIRRLDIRRTRTLSAPIAAFLALDDKPITLSYDGDTVALSADDLLWKIETWGTWTWMAEEYFEAMRTLITERVTSITLPFQYLATFFHACLQAPRLVSLEITFDGIVDEDSARLPRMPSFYGLQAPNLLRLTINVGGAEDDIRDSADIRDQVLTTLIEEFRSFIAYNADQLDTITLRCAYPDLVDCAALAHYAKEYIVVS